MRESIVRRNKNLGWFINVFLILIMVILVRFMIWKIEFSILFTNVFLTPDSIQDLKDWIFVFSDLYGYDIKIFILFFVGESNIPGNA